MSYGLYVSKPSVVEAVQWCGNNADEVIAFDAPIAWTLTNELSMLAGQDGAQDYVRVPRWHWLVRRAGDLTDHWPVDPAHFAAKYEPT
jgi:hypothetical protein